MPKRLEPLRIRAVQPNKVYIGATFCPDETAVRGVYERLDPAHCIEFNQARLDVQAGANATETVQSLGLSALQSVVMERCFVTIETGGCMVYPVK